jgi:hypothetical protein
LFVFPVPVLPRVEPADALPISQLGLPEAQFTTLGKKRILGKRLPRIDIGASERRKAKMELQKKPLARVVEATSKKVV